MKLACDLDTTELVMHSCHTHSKRTFWSRKRIKLFKAKYLLLFRSVCLKGKWQTDTEKCERPRQVRLAARRVVFLPTALFERRERGGVMRRAGRGGSIPPLCTIQDAQLAKRLSTPASCRILLVGVPSLSVACALAGSSILWTFFFFFSLLLKFIVKNKKSPAKYLSQWAGSWSRLQWDRNPTPLGRHTV